MLGACLDLCQGMPNLKHVKKHTWYYFVSLMQDSAGLDERGLWGGVSAWLWVLAMRERKQREEAEGGLMRSLLPSCRYKLGVDRDARQAWPFSGNAAY